MKMTELYFYKNDDGESWLFGLLEYALAMSPESEDGKCLDYGTEALYNWFISSATYGHRAERRMAALRTV